MFCRRARVLLLNYPGGGAENIAGWQFGGINAFWKNDFFFEIFILPPSFVFFPPANALFAPETGFKIHRIIKILPGFSPFRSAIGVGELFYKIDLMAKGLR